MTGTLITPDPAQYNTRLNLQINNTILDMPTDSLTTNTLITRYPKHLKLYKKSNNQVGKHKETLLSTFKDVTRPVQEYVFTI